MSRKREKWLQQLKSYLLFPWKLQSLRLCFSEMFKNKQCFRLFLHTMSVYVSAKLVSHSFSSHVSNVPQLEMSQQDDRGSEESTNQTGVSGGKKVWASSRYGLAPSFSLLILLPPPVTSLFNLFSDMTDHYRQCGSLWLPLSLNKSPRHNWATKQRSHKVKMAHTCAYVYTPTHWHTLAGFNGWIKNSKKATRHPTHTHMEIPLTILCRTTNRQKIFC